VAKIQIRYILGRPGSGKTTVILKEIACAQSQAGDSALIYLVPEQFSLQSEKNLIAICANRAISRAQVLSFRRLAYLVFAKTGGMDRRILEDVGKHMLLKKVLLDVANDLVYFRRAADKEGFVNKLAASITEFYQYGIEPDELICEDSGLSMKLDDLRLIYKTYKEYLEKEYISHDEILDVLANKLSQSDFLNGAHIWIDGFKSFTPQEQIILAQLMQQVSCMTVTLTLDAPNEEPSLPSPFQEMRKTFEQLNKMAQQAGAQTQEPLFLDTDYRHSKAPDLEFFCHHFLHFGGPVYHGKSPAIRLLACDNIYTEIHTAAKIVTHLLRDKNYRYNDIGIVCADLAKYSSTLDGIFAQYNIPVFVDAPRSILGHPLAELIRAALDIVGKNWRYEEIFKLLKTKLLPFNREDVDILENYVLAYGIRGKNRWQSDFTYGFESGNFDAQSLNAMRRDFYQLMTPLHDSLSPRSKYSARFIATMLFEFLSAAKVPQVLRSWADEAQLAGDNQQTREHEQIWSKVVQTFEKLVEILGDEVFTTAEFAKVMAAGFEGAELALAPPSLDQLLVGDMRRSRFGELKGLICLGAIEGAMPGPPTENGLISGDDRHALQDTVTLGADAEARILEEKFLIYAGFARPAEFLAISYPLGDLSGKANTPAVLLNRLTELFPSVKTTFPDKINPANPANISSPAQTLNQLVRLMRQYTDSDEDLPEMYMDAMAFLKGDPEYSRKLALIQDTVEFFGNPDNLSPKSIEKLYGGKIRASVSKIEKYIECPFSYFLRYNLNARRRKIYEVEPVDIGNIFHDILDDFAKKMAGQKISELSEQKVSDIAQASVQAVLKAPGNEILTTSGRYAHFAARVQEISTASTLAMAEHLRRGDFSMAFNEVSFFDVDGMGAIDIELDDGTMSVEGRIDRDGIMEIDGDSFVKIIDYKSGMAAFSLAEVYHGIQLQLLIYLGAFIEKWQKIEGADFVGKILPAAVFYFNLANPMIEYSKKAGANSAALNEFLLREFKMSGIVLEDKDVVFALDRTIDGDSDIMPVGLKKDGGLKKTSMVISREGFDALIKHSLNKAKKCGDDIIAGRIPISPYILKNRHSCRFCNYRAICRFDGGTNEGLRRLRGLSDNEVINQLGGGN